MQTHNDVAITAATHSATGMEPVRGRQRHRRQADTERSTSPMVLLGLASEKAPPATTESEKPSHGAPLNEGLNGMGDWGDGVDAVDAMTMNALMNGSADGGSAMAPPAGSAQASRSASQTPDGDGDDHGAGDGAGRDEFLSPGQGQERGQGQGQGGYGVGMSSPIAKRVYSGVEATVGAGVVDSTLAVASTAASAARDGTLAAASVAGYIGGAIGETLAEDMRSVLTAASSSARPRSGPPAGPPANANVTDEYELFFTKPQIGLQFQQRNSRAMVVRAVR